MACNDTNWLYNLKTNEWQLDQFASIISMPIFLDSLGFSRSGGDGNSSLKKSVRPTLYLTSNVQITGGSGTNSDPYTLGL